MRWFLVGLMSLGPVASLSGSEGIELASPDGAVKFVLSETDAGPVFRVVLDGQVVIDDSPLGLVPVTGDAWGPGMNVVDRRVSDHDQTWQPVWGTASAVRDHYRQLEVDWRDSAGRELGLVARAYDDGVAFRYRVPDQGEEVSLAGERTAFNVAEDARAFVLPLKGFRTSYEAGYRVCRISELENTLIGLPLTLECSGGKWASITEAHLDDYAGLYLAVNSEAKGLLTTRLSARKQSPAVVRTGAFDTPWRVVLLGRCPGDLIDNHTVLNCNPPCAIQDTSWIQPGKVMWDWWCKQMVSGVEFEGGMNTRTMKHYAQFAAESGFDYLLIDEGWSWWENVPDANGKMRRVTDITRAVPAIDLPEILEFCHRRGVRVWLWLTWSHCRDQMAEAFPLYEQWGVAGVKIDFMNSDDQWMVNWYHDVARAAAEHHLMVDMHGAYKPTGIRRTWPNMMTREALKGLEHSKWSSDVTPEHNVILPFTRMLAGPMDYTPGGFNVATIERFKPRDAAPFVMGTLCHQLAQYVVYESPIQMCVDYPERYRGRIGFEFLQWVPTTWDQSVTLDGYPGRFVAMARRHGNTWYLGCMSGNESHTLKVPLTFLNEGSWRLNAFADGARAAEVPEQVRRATRSVTAEDVLEVAMAPGGGYAARLVPEQDKARSAKPILHLVGFSFKPEVSEAQKLEVLRACDALPRRIPEIAGYKRHQNTAVAPRVHGPDHILVLRFRSAHDREAYLAHPVQAAFAEKYEHLLIDGVVMGWPDAVE